ncbi:MAG: helix-turn-helix domain-containing protein [Coriobacteriales bacterium]|jgi:transcriptional regulator with XRE-family HTH domain|nr:helix-turn-helix domain-containing protein [Coriobacteriales bacterium]
MLSHDVVATAANIGDNLRTWRKLLGLRSEQVAERAGISKVTYSKIENGATGVSLGNVLSVFRALGLMSKVESVTDPYEHDLGRARANQILPKRVRR